MDVLVDTKAVVYAETHRRSRHELHDPHCPFVRNCVWIPARFFVDDPDDPQSAKQRPAAALALSESAFVSVTVLLEFE